MTECIYQNLQNHILREMEFTVGDLYLNIRKGVKKKKKKDVKVGNHLKEFSWLCIFKEP